MRASRGDDHVRPDQRVPYPSHVRGLRALSSDPERQDLLAKLCEIYFVWGNRDAFVDAVTGAGQPEPIAQWLAMNLRRTADGGREFGPDLSAVNDLIEDYARTDCWDVVEALPERATLDFVIGGRSSAFSESDRARLAAIEERDARVSSHVIDEAGHWVHVDTPDAMVSLLR